MAQHKRFEFGYFNLNLNVNEHLNALVTPKTFSSQLLESAHIVPVEELAVQAVIVVFG